MHHLKRIVLLLVLFLFLHTSMAFSLELGLFFRLETLSFKNNRSSSNSSFSGPITWGPSAFLHHDFNDRLSIELDYNMDFTLRNIIASLFIYKGDIVSFGVGPFLGTFNSTEYIFPFGVCSYFRLVWPGVIFGDIRFDTTASNLLSESGNITQRYLRTSIGFYVPHVICSGNFIYKTYIETDSSSNKTADIFYEYSFTADIYKKNTPVSTIIKFGYQRSSREFFTGNTKTSDHEINSIILGTKLNIYIKNMITLVFDVDSSLYTFGTEDLLGESNPSYLFRASAGIIFNIDTMIERRKARKAYSIEEEEKALKEAQEKEEEDRKKTEKEKEKTEKEKERDERRNARDKDDEDNETSDKK